MIKTSRYLNKILSILTSFAIVFTFFAWVPLNATATDIWDGSSYDTSWYNKNESSFTIATAFELAGLAKLVNEGTTFEKKTITLSSNIDLNNNEWTPIGYYNSDTLPVKRFVFSGTFNGDGFVISNLKITGSDETLANDIGLFGYTKDANIKNLGIKDATIKETRTDGDKHYPSCLVGRAVNTEIANSYISKASVELSRDLHNSEVTFGPFAGLLAHSSLSNL